MASRHGHLWNAQAADGLSELLSGRVLYHLSRTNNLPALAQAEIGEVLAREGSPAQIVVSDQFEPTPWLEIPA
ncbi:MAG: hypothetical protein ACRD2Z_15665 [Thermoanaerobaculia bacterium]